MRDPVTLFFVGLTCGIVVGLALAIVFQNFFSRLFGSRKERELAMEVKTLKNRLKKKDELIKKAVKEVEKTNRKECKNHQ